MSRLNLGKVNPFCQTGITRRRLERDVEREILDYLEANVVGLFWKNYSSGVYDPQKKIFRPMTSVKGVPDILGIVAGMFIGIEVKTPHNKVRPPHQVEFRDKVVEQGGICFFADSVDAVKEELKLLGVGDG